MEYIYKQTGLARSTISALYHDKMDRYDRDTLDKLCKLFKCPISELLEFYENEPE